MKTYLEFKEEIREKILEFIPNRNNKEAVITKVQRNNSIFLDGLTIKDNTLSVQMAPTIYLNELYLDYCNGKSIKEILFSISMTFRNPAPPLQINEVFKIENVILSVMNKSKNLSLLKEVPYIDFEDLAITFRYYVGSPNQNVLGTVLIKNDTLPMTDLKALYYIAAENTYRILGVKISTMEETVEELIRFDDELESEIKLNENDKILANVMYVITNNKNLHGANLITNKNIFKKIADANNSDLVYILPSSVHELLAIPANYVTNATDLHQMVAEVNKTMIAPDEILSDNVYIYSKILNSIKIA